MSLPYSTATSGDKALAEIQRILQQFGCNKFGVMTDWTEGVLMVQFEWRGARVSFPANFKGYASAWLKENPWTTRKSLTKAQWEAKALEIGSVAVYSILRDCANALGELLPREHAYRRILEQANRLLDRHDLDGYGYGNGDGYGTVRSNSIRRPS